MRCGLCPGARIVRGPPPGDGTDREIGGRKQARGRARQTDEADRRLLHLVGPNDRLARVPYARTVPSVAAVIPRLVPVVAPAAVIIAAVVISAVIVTSSYPPPESPGSDQPRCRRSTAAVVGRGAV